MPRAESVPFELSQPFPRRVAEFFGASYSGVSVTPDTAMRCAAVFSCIRVVTEDLGKLPLILYRRLKNGGKERATDHPCYWLMQSQPNDWQTPMEFKGMLQGHAELRGNAFALPVRYKGEVRELLPLQPHEVKVRQDGGWKVTYERTTGDRGTYRPGEILALRHLTLDGLRGLSTIGYARESVGLALAMERYGAKLFANQARPGGLLKHPGKLSDAAAKRLKESFEEMHGGENLHRTALLEESMTWESVGMNNEDAQFVEGQKYKRSEIAGLFRVPPHKIADLEKATFSNIEHQSLEYVGDALMPRGKRWEEALNRALLTPAERKEFFFEFLFDAVLRADTATRYEAEGKAIRDGWKTRNEVRISNNLNPADPALDEYIQPLNMGTAGRPPAEPEASR
jgi:HK97 family phage portal protein